MGGYLTEKNDLGIDSEILVASVVELFKRGVATRPLQDLSARRRDGIVHRPRRRLRLLRRQSADRAARYRVGQQRAAHCRHPQSGRDQSGVDDRSDRASRLRVDRPDDVHRPGRTAGVEHGRALLRRADARFTCCRRRRATAPCRASSRRYRRVRSSPSRARSSTSSSPSTASPTSRASRNAGEPLALIELAHPDFRDQLRAEARRLFWP